MSKYLPNIEIKAADLPSRGISYPPNATISYETYSFGEVQKSTSSSFTDLRGTINIALGGIKTNGFDKMRLTLFDVFFLGLHRKAVSLGTSKLEMPYICRKCGEKNNFLFSPSDIEFKDLDEIITELPAIMTIDDRELEFHFLTVGKFLEHYTPGKMLAEKTAALMVTNMPLEEAQKLIANTRDEQEIFNLKQIDKLLAHDILPLKATCKKCSTENYIKLEGREALLQPFRDGEEPLRHSIQFGKKQSSGPVLDKEDGVSGSDKSSQKIGEVSK